MRAPNIGPLQSLLCLIGWHRRGRKHARVQGRERARCSACKRMLELRHGLWRVVD